MIFHLKRSCIKFKHKIKCVFLLQGDVILLTGVRCTEETYTDGANGVRTTVYRLIIPDERNIDCRVLPAEHSSTKQVCIFINSWLEQHLANINAGFDEDVGAEHPDSNPINQQTSSNLFPDSQEFNRIVLEASNITGLSRPSQHAEVAAGPSQHDEQQQPEVERPKRSVASQMMLQQETEYSRHSR